MNALKVVIDGGWIIRETEMERIISMVSMTEDIGSLSLILGHNEKKVKEVAMDIVHFFQQAMQEFSCSPALV